MLDGLTSMNRAADDFSYNVVSSFAICTLRRYICWASTTSDSRMATRGSRFRLTGVEPTGIVEEIITGELIDVL